MSSSDGPNSAFNLPRRTAGRRVRPVDSHLLEALMYLLIEKGVLTKNDALSVVETVAHVKRGVLEEAEADGDEATRTKADLILLQRLYGSFEALDDRPDVLSLSGENVHRLRPPLHRDRPTFPQDD